jgi:hypothetical protein
MPKIANAHHIQIERHGDRAKVSQVEYETSAEEWYRRRTDAFAQLRKTRFIPDELLDLVEHFNERTLVEPFVYTLPTPEVALRFGVKIAGKQEDRCNTKRFAELMAAHKRTQDDDEKDGWTGSETLAFMLRMMLRNLKHAERNRQGAPVRSLNLAPRSLIAEIAMGLLESCETWGHPPGPLLNSLLRELLNLEHYGEGKAQDVATQKLAAGIVAHNPTVGTRQLAKALHLNASTISRWRRSPEFKKLVERKLESSLANQGEIIEPMSGEELSRFLEAVRVVGREK